MIVRFLYGLKVWLTNMDDSVMYDIRLLPFHKAWTDAPVGIAQYEPELFAGLIYRMQNPKVVMLIFVTGKVVITGPKVRCALSKPAAQHRLTSLYLCARPRLCVG